MVWGRASQRYQKRHAERVEWLRKTPTHPPSRRRVWGDGEGGCYAAVGVHPPRCAWANSRTSFLIRSPCARRLDQCQSAGFQELATSRATARAG